MEFMSKDKFIVFDLKKKMKPTAISITGLVSSFGKARIIVQSSQRPNGPWTHVTFIRALGDARKTERHTLPNEIADARYYRLYIRREGHATFKHSISNVQFHCADDEGGTSAK